MSDNNAQNISIKRNTWATAGLILGLLSLFLSVTIVIPLFGIFCSYKGLTISRKINGYGKRKAIVGLILSSLMLIVTLLLVLSSLAPLLLLR